MDKNILVFEKYCLSTDSNIFNCISNNAIGLVALYQIIMNIIICAKLIQRKSMSYLYIPVYITVTLQSLIIIVLNVVVESFQLNKILYLSSTQFFYCFMLIFIFLNLAIAHSKLKTRLYILFIIATITFAFGVYWNISTIVLYTCGQSRMVDYVVHVIIELIFQLILWRLGNRQIRYRVKKSTISRIKGAQQNTGALINSFQSSQTVYNPDDGYIKTLKKSIKRQLISLSVWTIVFYIAMAIWNDSFKNFYDCSGDYVFYPKNIEGQVINIIKAIAIQCYSQIINWFFYNGRQENRASIPREGDIKKSVSDKSYDDDNTNTHYEAMHNHFGSVLLGRGAIGKSCDIYRQPNLERRCSSLSNEPFDDEAPKINYEQDQMVNSTNILV